MGNVYQMDMFGGPDEKIKKKRKKMSDKEKAERREKRELDKKIKAEKEFEDKMASIGHPQLYMFDDNGNITQNNNESKEYKNLTSENMKPSGKTIKLSENEFHKLVKESVKKIIKENSYESIREIDTIFKNFGNQIYDLTKKYKISEVADRKIGRLIFALKTLVEDSINRRDSITTTWGIEKLDI